MYWSGSGGGADGEELEEHGEHGGRGPGRQQRLRLTLRQLAEGLTEPFDRDVQWLQVVVVPGPRLLFLRMVVVVVVLSRVGHGGGGHGWGHGRLLQGRVVRQCATGDSGWTWRGHLGATGRRLTRRGCDDSWVFGSCPYGCVCVCGRESVRFWRLTGPGGCLGGKRGKPGRGVGEKKIGSKRLSGPYWGARD